MEPKPTLARKVTGLVKLPELSRKESQNQEANSVHRGTDNVQGISMRANFLSPMEAIFVSIEKIYIKLSRKCFIGYPNTSDFVKSTPLRVVFLTLISVFGYPDETLSLVFEILHHRILS